MSFAPQEYNEVDPNGFPKQNQQNFKWIPLPQINYLPK